MERTLWVFWRSGVLFPSVRVKKVEAVFYSCVLSEPQGELWELVPTSVGDLT